MENFRGDFMSKQVTISKTESKLISLIHRQIRYEITSEVWKYAARRKGSQETAEIRMINAELKKLYKELEENPGKSKEIIPKIKELNKKKIELYKIRREKTKVERAKAREFERGSQFLKWERIIPTLQKMGLPITPMQKVEDNIPANWRKPRLDKLFAL